MIANKAEMAKGNKMMILICVQVLIILTLALNVTCKVVKTSVRTDMDLAPVLQKQQTTPSSDMESRIKELEAGILNLQREIDRLNNTGHSKRNEQPAPPSLVMTDQPATTEIGFHVRLESTQRVARGDTLKFDQAVTRIGNAYDTNTGVFTCVRTGTYMFSMSIVSEQHHHIEAAIVKNNNISILNAVSDSNARGAGNQGGGMAIVHMIPGDTVCVKVVWIASGSVGDVCGHGLSSFSGYLLRESN